MAKIDPAQLAELMREAGISERTAKKLREANDKLGGHGPARPDRKPAGSL